MFPSLRRRRRSRSQTQPLSNDQEPYGQQRNPRGTRRLANGPFPVESQLDQCIHCTCDVFAMAGCLDIFLRKPPHSQRPRFSKLNYRSYSPAVGAPAVVHVPIEIWLLSSTIQCSLESSHLSRPIFGFSLSFHDVAPSSLSLVNGTTSVLSSCAGSFRS